MARRNTKAAKPEATTDATRDAEKTVTTPMLVGFDLGTNVSCVHAKPADADAETVSTCMPTVVGYASEGIIDSVLPGNADKLFGADALKKRLHLKLVWPLHDGVIADLHAARDFARNVRDNLGVGADQDVRAVIGVPADVDEDGKETLRQTVTGIFDRVLLIPEPFLAALGYRDESKLGEDDYVDPVSNSIFVDIGAGTTDISLIQGYYPQAEDQLSFAMAGDAVDALLADGIVQTYPDCALSPIKVREIKETFSYVGDSPGAVETKVMVAGKPRKLQLTEQVGSACEALLKVVQDGVMEMISRVDSDMVEETLQNIILTGGGSQIRGIAEELQRRLTEEGYEAPCVKTVGPDYKEFVAKGALKAASQAREQQWQVVLV